MNTAEIGMIWSLLGQTWGAKFLEQYGPKPNEAWSAALASVEPDAAKYALTKLIDSGSAFPPTLPEFVVWAKKYRPVEICYDANGRAYLAGERVPIEYRQRSTPEVAQANLARLREMLKGIV
jgi:hypothetical protein